MFSKEIIIRPKNSGQLPLAMALFCLLWNGNQQTFLTEIEKSPLSVQCVCHLSFYIRFYSLRQSHSGCACRDLSKWARKEKRPCDKVAKRTLELGRSESQICQLLAICLRES